MSHYRIYSEYLKDKYFEKVYKLPISLPVTCPNRDGACGVGGCTFCGEIGVGYEADFNRFSISSQLDEAIAYIGPRYKAKKFIAYFQNFTNTYLPLEDFRDAVHEAAKHPAVVGVAIATRPDCVHSAYLEVLSAVREKHNVDIILEIGLQSVNPNSLVAINRGHTVGEYIDAILRISPYQFEVCTHVIANLPGDSRIDVIEAAKIISALPVQQVKLHALYIVKNTKMASQYLKGEIEVCSLPEYINRVVDFIEHLRSDIVLQRLVGRVPEDVSVFANWGRAWWVIRDMIEAEFERRKSRQGAKCNYLGGAAVNKFVKGDE